MAPFNKQRFPSFSFERMKKKFNIRNIRIAVVFGSGQLNINSTNVLFSAHCLDQQVVGESLRLDEYLGAYELCEWLRWLTFCVKSLKRRGHMWLSVTSPPCNEQELCLLTKVFCDFLLIFKKVLSFTSAIDSVLNEFRSYVEVA